MARLTGKNGRLYVAIASGGTAEPIAFITKFNINAATDKIKQTAFGDANQVYGSGLPDSQGAYEGWYDDATQQLLTAAQDGVARKWYFYPSTNDTTKYWYGTALFDFGLDEAYDAGVAIKGSWAAATTTTRV